MNRAPIAALLLCLSSLAVLGYQWLDVEQSRMKEFAWTRPAPLKPELPTLATSPAVESSSRADATYISMLERPLFSPERRVPPPVIQAAEPPPDPINNLQVMGLFFGERPGVVAKIDGRSRRVQLNDKVGEWTLDAVDRSSASFHRGAEKRIVALTFSSWGNAPRPSVGQKTAGSMSVGSSVATSSRSPADQAIWEERVRVINEIRARAGMLGQ